MRTLWNSSNYGNDLKMTRNDAESCSHSGDNEADVLRVIKKPYIKKQLAKIDPAQLVKELHGYGAWDDEQLKDHEQNLIRWVWISAGDITEGKK